MTWEIFLGIVALVGFFLTVGSPILKLNSSIVRLNESINVLRDIISRNEADNKEAHKRIWGHLDGIDNTIKDHENRIKDAEDTISYQGEKLTGLAKDTVDQERRITVMETENRLRDKGNGGNA